MKRFRIALALALLSGPVSAQQFMELPPSTIMGNVTTQTNPGSAVSMAQLIAAMQKSGVPIANISMITGLGAGVQNFLATPSGTNLLAALTTKTGTGVPVFGTAPTITGATLSTATIPSPSITAPTGIVKGDVGLGNVANVDTTNAGNISSGTLPAARLPLTSASLQTSPSNPAATASTVGVMMGPWRDVQANAGL